MREEKGIVGEIGVKEVLVEKRKKRGEGRNERGEGWKNQSEEEKGRW